LAEELTWVDRLDVPVEVEIRLEPEGRTKLRAGESMLFPNGRAVEAVIRTIPRGHSMTRQELRTELTQMYGAVGT